MALSFTLPWSFSVFPHTSTFFHQARLCPYVPTRLRYSEITEREIKLVLVQLAVVPAAAGTMQSCPSAELCLVPSLFHALYMPRFFQHKILNFIFSAVSLLKQNVCSWSSQNSHFKRHTVKVLVQNCFEAVIRLIPDQNLITFGFQLFELFPCLRCFKGLSASCSWFLTTVQWAFSLEGQMHCFL